MFQKKRGGHKRCGRQHRWCSGEGRPNAESGPNTPDTHARTQAHAHNTQHMLRRSERLANRQAGREGRMKRMRGKTATKKGHEADNETRLCEVRGQGVGGCSRDWQCESGCTEVCVGGERGRAVWWRASSRRNSAGCCRPTARLQRSAREKQWIHTHDTVSHGFRHMGWGRQRETTTRMTLNPPPR